MSNYKAFTGTYPVSTTLTAKMVNDTLSGAFEGGSNYWIDSLKWDGNDRIVILSDAPDLQSRVRPMNVDTIQAGVQWMAKNQPKHFSDMLTGNDDATTSDILLQSILFQEIIFG